MDERDERVRFMAKLPPDLHRWLKVSAAERGTDMNVILIAALESKRDEWAWQDRAAQEAASERP
jgi:predicted HicB family RNase H-like nuclease